MDKLEKTIEIFRKLPGIGPRQAKRIVYSLLKNSVLAKSLSEELRELNKQISNCEKCKRFFAFSEKDNICQICKNKDRNSEILMIVERDSDLESMEKSRVYSGLYFVLGGVVPVLSSNPEKIIRIADLEKRIKNDLPKEIIFALSATPEGEHTSDYLNNLFRDFFREKNIKVSMLGRGLSTGTELEYADPETLRSALENRH